MSTGFDNITVKFLKHILDYVAPVLGKIINISFTTGIF